MQVCWLVGVSWWQRYELWWRRCRCVLGVLLSRFAVGCISWGGWHLVVTIKDRIRIGCMVAGISLLWCTTKFR